MEENKNAVLNEQQADAKAPEEMVEKSSSHHHHSSGNSSHHHHSSGKSSRRSSSGKSSHRSSSGKSSHHSSSGKSSHHHSSGNSSHHHHHSSSSKSSKKKKKKSNTDYSKLRSLFSFLLFLSIAATAVFAGVKISVLNETVISDVFTNSEYVDALYEDVLDYSRDMCMKNGIPQDYLKDTITYKNIKSIQKAYISGVLLKDESYSETTYSDKINKLCSRLETKTAEMIKNNDIEVSEKQVDVGAKTFSKEIATYLKGKVELSFVSDIQGILNVSTPVINVGIGLFAVLAFAFFLLTISIEGKNYRSIRPVAISFLSAALMNTLLVAFVGIVGIFKDLVIYPSYLCDSIHRYINTCAVTYLFEAFLLFFVGMIICALVWKLKRENE